MGDYRLIHQLFATHARRVKGFFSRHIVERGDAADLSQEVFLRLLRLSDLSKIEDPQGYLFTVAHNLLRERAHSQGRKGPRIAIEEALNAPELSVEPVAESEVDAERLVERLRAALRVLPTRDREMLAMVYEQQLSYREIARQLGISKTAVGNAVEKATVRCRRYMEQSESV